VSVLQPTPVGDATAMSLQGSEALSRTFQELKSKNQDIRLKASYDLSSLIVSAARGMNAVILREHY